MTTAEKRVRSRLETAFTKAIEFEQGSKDAVHVPIDRLIDLWRAQRPYDEDVAQDLVSEFILALQQYAEAVNYETRIAAQVVQARNRTAAPQE